MADFFDVPAFDDNEVGRVFQRAAEAGALADSRRVEVRDRAVLKV